LVFFLRKKRKKTKSVFGAINPHRLFYRIINILFMQTTFLFEIKIYCIMLSIGFFDFFPFFFGRISEKWTKINVLFFMTPLTFFWEFFLGMIELFSFL
jgi:hypothetical protein